MKMNPSLETIPAELKLALLKHLPDYSSLTNLVRASPTFHYVYITNRDEVLTGAVLRDLANRNIDVTTPFDFVQITTKADPLNLHLESALVVLQQQIANAKPIRLSINHCIALHTLRTAETWHIREDYHGVPRAFTVGEHSPHFCAGAPLHLFNLSTHSMTDVRRLKADVDAGLWQKRTMNLINGSFFY